MSNEIESFGGDGPHEVRFGTGAGEQTVWVKRDVWWVDQATDTGIVPAGSGSA